MKPRGLRGRPRATAGAGWVTELYLLRELNLVLVVGLSAFDFWVTPRAGPFRPARGVFFVPNFWYIFVYLAKGLTSETF